MDDAFGYAAFVNESGMHGDRLSFSSGMDLCCWLCLFFEAVKKCL